MEKIQIAPYATGKKQSVDASDYASDSDSNLKQSGNKNSSGEKWQRMQDITELYNACNENAEELEKMMRNLEEGCSKGEISRKYPGAFKKMEHLLKGVLLHVVGTNITKGIWKRIG